MCCRFASKNCHNRKRGRFQVHENKRKTPYRKNLIPFNPKCRVIISPWSARFANVPAAGKVIFSGRIVGPWRKCSSACLGGNPTAAARVNSAFTWRLSRMQSGRCLPLRSSLGTNRNASLLEQQHKTFASHWRGNPQRPETSVKSANRFKSFGVSCFSSKRQRQFPFARPGKFIRASEPSPSTSCRGTTAISATDVRIA